MSDTGTYAITIKGFAHTQEADRIDAILDEYMTQYRPGDHSSTVDEHEVYAWYNDIRPCKGEDIVTGLAAALNKAGFIASHYVITAHEEGDFEADPQLSIWRNGKVSTHVANADGQITFTASEVAKALSESGEAGVREMLAAVGVAA